MSAYRTHFQIKVAINVLRFNQELKAYHNLMRTPSLHGLVKIKYLLINYVRCLYITHFSERRRNCKRRTICFWRNMCTVFHKMLHMQKKIWQVGKIVDSLIWFRGGRDACPAVPLLLKWVKLGTTVLLQGQKYLQGCNVVPSEKQKVFTQRFIPHINVIFIVIS